MGTDCGIKYIMECIKTSKNNEHWAYLTEDTKFELERRGFTVKQKDKHTMSRISWPKF
jgi:hypothetical protein